MGQEGWCVRQGPHEMVCVFKYCIDVKPNSICFAFLATPGAECPEIILYKDIASSLRPCMPAGPYFGLQDG